MSLDDAPWMSSVSQHDQLVLLQVLGGLVRALDDLVEAGLLDLHPTLDEDRARALDAPVEWQVLRWQMREARALLLRQARV
jgi:hypothetical protein